MRRQILSAALLFSGPTAVAAAETVTSQETPDLVYVHLVLFLLGLLLAAYWAVEAFSRASVTLGDLPTLPKYMTRANQYTVGLLAFTVIAMCLYALAAYLHRQVIPAISIFFPQLYEPLKPHIEGNSPKYLFIILLLSSAYLYLLKHDAEWNILLILRRVIQGWVSIPYLANTLMTLARDALVVPKTGIGLVIDNPATPYVAADDFTKGKKSLDRAWAELSYMRAWLEQQQRQGSHATFFNEPSFCWHDLLDEYDKLSAQIAPLKRGESNDPQLFALSFKDVNVLRNNMCRLVACYLLFKNDTQAEIVAHAKAFGIYVDDPVRENPLRYAIMYLVAVALSVYFGVYLSAVLVDVLQGMSVSDAMRHQDSDLIWRWVGLSVANTGVPICGILLAKYLGWHADPHSHQTYLASYCWIFIAAFCLAPPSLALAIKIIGSSEAAARPFLVSMGRGIRWAIGPGLICVYIAYYLDRQCDPNLPSVGQDGTSPWVRCLYACLYSIFVVVLLLPAAAAIQARPTSPWPVEKLQAVALGTSFLMTMTVALVAQFGLRRASAERQNLEASDLAAAEERHPVALHAHAETAHVASNHVRPFPLDAPEAETAVAVAPDGEIIC
jgi:hypothetical protein